jgi:Na+-translocating ferredoxin:NAD+ oxidoreductase RnfD subunit
VSPSVVAADVETVGAVCLGAGIVYVIALVAAFGAQHDQGVSYALYLMTY